METQGTTKHETRGWLYLLLSIVFWIAVDIGVGYKFDVARWSSNISTAWVFYLLWPLLFYYLFYFRLWDTPRALILIAVLSYIIEAVLLNNFYLYNLPHLLLYIPVTILLYSFITLVPLWIAQGSARQHIVKILFMLAVILVFALLV